MVQNSSDHRLTPDRSRIVAIIHLCLAFTLLAARVGYPFMGELYAIKSRQVVYDSVMGKGNAGNAERYAQLSKEKKAVIERGYQTLQKKLQSPFRQKLKRAIKILVFALPPFEKAWIAFSILIPILLLLRIEGAVQAAWVLPLITFVYILNSNSWSSQPLVQGKELFPTEDYVVRRYLNEPPKGNISIQQKQLLKGWYLYLIHEWTGQAPSLEPSTFSKQIEEGEFFFNVARLDALPPFQGDEDLFRKKPSLIASFFYLLWNTFFVWFLYRNKKRANERSYLLAAR